MLNNKVFEELKRRCGLTEKQATVLKSLREEDLPAKKLASKSGIPLGRLYQYVNELLSYGLIEKKGKKPCVYSIENMNEKIRDFMKKRFDEVIENEKVITDMMQKKEESDYIEITKTKEEFMYTQLKMLGVSKKFYTLSRYGSIPFMIYPAKYEDFIKFRKIIGQSRPTLAHSSPETTAMVNKAYIDAYKSGKSLIAIVSKESLDFHFDIARKKIGKEFLFNIVRDLKERIKKYKIKIYLLNEYLPIQIFVNENTVFLSMIHEGATPGTIIHSKNVSDIYLQMLEGMIARSMPIENYLKQVLRD